MPKQLIRGMDADRDIEGAVPTEVRVGWSREAGEVQVATIAPDGVDLEPTPEGNGWFVSLDRAGCNAAIRALQRARDGAYGKDA